jgi:hypothetical protein
VIVHIQILSPATIVTFSLKTEKHHTKLKEQNFTHISLILNAQIELKKLSFHTKDAKGKSKCHVLHVGRNSDLCPTLLVHGTNMSHVSEDTYLGDVISNDGRNTKNINSRIGKGLGKINDIMNMLEKVSLGHEYFKIALLLRESIFLNSILSRHGILYNSSAIKN